MRTTRRSASLLLAAYWLFAGAASAQYFGQNKVRFKDMNFQVLHTAHFDIHFYPEERKAAELAARMSERWYARLSNVLQHELPPNQPVILYDSGPAFRATTVIPEEISVGTGGVTEGLRRRVILPFAGSLAETDHVLGHELVHAFQYAMTSGRGDTAAGGVPGAATLPLWFIEGMAEYLSVGPVDPNTAMWLRDAVARKKLPSLKNLDDPEYFPYRFGQAFWSYVGGTYGDSVVGRMMRAAGRARSVESAIQSVLKLQPELLIERWHTALNEAYAPVIAKTEPADREAQTVIAAKKGKDSLNVSPAISPDGQKMVVFSQRGLFSVDLYLANVQTGELTQRLTKEAVDPHLGSMDFIQSAGAWRPDGGQYAFATVKGGWPHLAIYDFRQNRISRLLNLRPLGEIYSPTWSPDGKQIAFSAMAGGLTDLYVFDVESKKLRRLTEDAYADLQPAWSPSGRYLAFVTDRFGTNLNDLSYGEYRLALLDIQNGQISTLPALPDGKHIDPHWGESDDTLFFISDQQGISNVYRLDRHSNSVAQLTNLQNGVTGITSLSPAISVARREGRLVFSAFREGMYSIYSIDTNRPQQRSAQLSYKSAATLPPVERTTNAVEEAQQRPKAGLPDVSSFKAANYRPRLSLDYFAPPTISAGVGTYGALIGGGTALYWSDLLEQHQLMTSFQSMATSSGNIHRNIGAVVAYQNQRSRWTWGVIGGQVPYLTGSYGSAVASVDGQPVLVEEQTTFWQLERQAKGVFSYPFNRAMRFELTGGYDNMGFAAETQRLASDLTTGEVIDSQKTSPSVPDAFHFGTGSAALVYDTSVFGGTSPVWGRRFRFEGGTQAGTINFTTALADYRQYFLLPGNLTFAVRALHYGRYGGGAEDSRLQDLFLGYPSLVRGYTVSSFTAEDCGAALTQTGNCPAFDQLVGSRIGVANAEVRVPILGALGLIPSRGIPPVELAPFFDAGVAWRSTELAAFRTKSRSPVRSYGGSLRVNVLGFFVAQFSYVRPMDRPTGWRWEFSVVPGF